MFAVSDDDHTFRTMDHVEMFAEFLVAKQSSTEGRHIPHKLRKTLAAP